MYAHIFCLPLYVVSWPAWRCVAVSRCMTCLLEDIQGSLFFCSHTAVLLPLLIQHLLNEVQLILIQWAVLSCRLHDNLARRTSCLEQPARGQSGLLLHERLWHIRTAESSDSTHPAESLSRMRSFCLTATTVRSESK